MRPFSKSTTFAFINIANFFTEDLDAVGKTMEDVFKHVHQGILTTPSPMTIYPVGEIETAFRVMQQGKHRGKLVLSLANDAKAPVLRKARDTLRLDPKATYLLVGGLGGLGRSLAREFIECGARNIAFISRSGDTNAEARATIDELCELGAHIKAYRGDVGHEKSFLAAMDQCLREMPAIKGVVQMAMVLRDIVFEKMSYEDWTIPLRPKVQGTWNLHRFFDHDRPLDFFIICSSLSGIFGNASQAQYAAGNTYQDALAHYRCARGLRAVTVNLGIMRDVGVLAEQGSGNVQQWEDVLGIREPAFHALMKSLIIRQQDGDNTCPAQVCTGLGAGDLIATHGVARPYWFNDARFGPLAATSVAVQSGSGSFEQGGAASLESRLAEAGSKEQAIEIITEALVKKIAEILQMPSSEVDPGRPMYRYGVDSLVALEIRNWITREMKANIALLEILAAVPIKTFAGIIAKKSKLIMDSKS
jgi:zearalenone synthase (highly reducing iterative type I polyketide synthase)